MKVKGIGRHVVIDKNVFLIAIMVTVVKIILADGGYRGSLVAEIKKKFGYMLKITLRTDKLNNSFEPISKRWIIERTFA